MLSADTRDLEFQTLVKQSNKIEVVSLGQSGFRWKMDDVVIYIDPYLSDQVEKIEGQDYKRQTPVWKSPNLITDATWVVVTHLHLDHCDLETILPISVSSPACHFIAPKNVCDFLAANGIANYRLITAPTSWLELSSQLKIHAVPATHPKIEFDAAGNWMCVGYVLEYKKKRFYHAGDTALSTPMIDYLKLFAPLDVAFLPVNEMNYYRNERGIIGNMGLRDAFQFATELGAKKVVPMHWDMFIPNSLHREEIELFYQLTNPPFELVINPDHI